MYYQTYDNLATDVNALLTKGADPDKITATELRQAMQQVSDFMKKGRTREFFPQDFAPTGTDAVCRRSLVCDIGASSSTVSAPAGTFESDIVGKKLKISFAAANGNDLVGNVTARASDGSSVTLDVTSSASTPSHPKVTYWGTDMTSYIQAAINACYGLRRGRVVFDCLMVVAGPIIGTSVDASSNYNCQIYLPFQSYADAARGGYELEGDTCMQYSDNGPGNVGYTRPSMEAGGMVSFLTTSSTNAAVIGTGGPTSGAGTYNGNNYSNIQIRKLKVLVPTNGGSASAVGAGIGGVDMKKAVNHQIYESIFGIDDNLGYSVASAYEHVGLNGNDMYTDAMNEWSKINTYGFHAGFRQSNEHTRATSLQAYGCLDAFQIKEGMFTLYGDSWIMHWGKNFMRVIAGAEGKSRHMRITNAEVEALNVGNHPIIGSVSWTAASSNGFYIDPGQKGTGIIEAGGTYSGGGVGVDPTQLGAGMKITGPFNVASSYN